MKWLPRWLQHVIRGKEAKEKGKDGDGMNRAAFRAVGIQGRRGSALVPNPLGTLDEDGNPVMVWMGPRRRSFLGPNAMPSILVPYTQTIRYRQKFLRRLQKVMKTKTVAEGEDE
jgi:hypothetical protein